MKKNKKFLLLTVLSMIMGATFVFLAGCDKKNMVTYSFETNGGVAIADVKVEEGKNLDLPIPQREGYSFEGWYTNADFEGEPVTSVLAENGLTYYAKWAQLYTITLDLNGGSLAETTLYLKAGENVYDFMQAYVPTKDGFQFGAWFNGSAELGKNTRMPEAELALTAQYKVSYTVELMLQNMDKSGYTKSEEVLTGYDYVGTEFAPEAEVTGFKPVSRSDARALSATASENVFWINFDRQEYTVSFDTNYPDGSENEGATVKVLYGQEVDIPNDYLYEGYCLIGWATTPNGEIVYESDYIDSVLYNKSEEVTEVTFTPTKNTTLYAVWEKGYIDMFGGSDYIYLLEEDGAQVVYLSRGGVFFKGQYSDVDGEAKFRFQPESEDETREGKLNENGTYVYRNEDRVGKSSTLLENGALVESCYIQFDAYNNLTYYVADQEGITTTSEGTYLIDENNFYVVTFTEGALAGETMTIAVGNVLVDGVTTPVFQIQNEEEAALGILYCFYVDGAQLNAYNVYQFIITGFGTAYYFNGSSYSAYYYTFSEDMSTLTLRNSSQSVVGVAHIMEVNGYKGYMFYSETLDQTFELTTGGTLKLDGVCNAVYTNGSTKVTGYYSLSDSLFGGSIITIQTASQAYKFLLTATTTEVPVVGGEAGETQKVTTYTVEEKNGGYAEFTYTDGKYLYAEQLLVVNEPQAGMATVYAEKTDGGYEKMSEGTFAFNNETNLYVYTATKFFETEAEVAVEPWDLSTINSFVCTLDVTTTSYSLHYWHSVTTGDGTTALGETYTQAEGDASLSLFEDIAVYFVDGKVSFMGFHQTSNGITLISSSAGYLYLELDEDAKTFILLNDSPLGGPYQATALLENGQTNANEYLMFDGKGGVTYTLITVEGETKNTTTVVGTYTDTEKTSLGGYPIYLFSSEELTFEFIQPMSSSAVYFTRYNQTYNGQYRSDGAGIFELDGFSVTATYVDGNGTSYVGSYYVYGENEIIFIADEVTFFFDVLEEKRFTVRGLEFGTYVIMDNQNFTDYLIELDGYNNLTVYTYEEDETAESGYKRVDIDTEGSYEIDGNSVTLSYTADNATVELEGVLGTYTDSSYIYYVFIVNHEEVVREYVNVKDWSVLKIDGYGNATKYYTDGSVETGMYRLITDSLLYYVKNEATDEADACIYAYDNAVGTATPITFKQIAYYTTDLECLLFSSAGFAIIDGTEQYYYNVEGGRLIVYTQNTANGTPNAYGYVREDWGVYSVLPTDTKEYNGKTYYGNGGYDIAFTRVEASAEKFPVLVKSGADKQPLKQLVFRPSGKAEFTVEGSIMFDGLTEPIPCYVTREKDDEGNVKMYITCGYYCFDITVSYTGSGGNTYEVTGMSWMLSAPSYTFLDTYYMYYIMDAYFGTDYLSTYTNQIGAIALVREYDEAGEVTEFYLVGEFGEESKMKDTTGEIVTVEKGEAEEVGNGVYKSEFVAADGYTYRIYLGLAQHEAFGIYGYQLYAFTRVETLKTSDNAYTVEVESVIATESENYTIGQIFSISLTKGEEKLTMDTGFTWGDEDIYYLVRTKDEDGNVTATDYYKITLVQQESDGTLNGSTTGVALYESVTVTKENGSTVYTADGKSFAEITETDGVIMFSVEGMAYYVKSCEKDSETGVYTVVTYGGATYTVEVVEGNVEITLVPVQADTATEQA